MRQPFVVVITGASAGVGRALARELARQGADLALLARDEEGLQAAKAEAEEGGVTAVAITCDVADAARVEAAADETERVLGPIDVWVNNAMTTVFGPFETITPEEYRRVTDVTYLGYVYGTLSAMRRMQPRNRGVIVQVGSALAYRSIPLQSAYCGAKAAIRGFTDSVRSELFHAHSKVKLTMVQLPALNTPQFDIGRVHLDKQPQPVPPIYQPEVAARAIARAIRRPRREYWVGLPVLEALLGQRLFPGLLDRYLARKAWEGSMVDQPVEADRPGNLFSPVEGDPGAHGRFEDRSKPHSPLTWISGKRGWFLGALAAVAGGLLLQRSRA
ncbi:MAG: SDR family oxidoreductase [Myxococcota bacterium]